MSEVYSGSDRREQEVAQERREGEKHDHPTPALYIKIAGILAVITFAELIYPYATEGIKSLDVLYFPVLGIMSAVKFYIVCAFFMHLKYDPPFLTHVYVLGLVVATLFMTAFLFLFNVV